MTRPVSGPKPATIVLRMGAVGGTDLAQAGAGLGHQLGDAEGAADLDEFAAGHDRLAAGREGVDDEQHRGGVVVHHRAVLGPRHLAQEFADVIVALAAAAGVEVVFQRHRAAHGVDGRADRGFGQQGAAEVGVQHRAGEVEQRPQRRAVPRGEPSAGVVRHGLAGEVGLGAGPQGRPQVGHGGADRLCGLGTPEAPDQRRAFGAAHHVVDPGQVAQAGRQRRHPRQYPSRKGS